MSDTPATMDAPLDRASEIALGRASILDDAPPIRLRGAVNDYNARGNGSTMARRILRDGSWRWLSAPASKGRVLSADRHDVTYGDAWVGEIIAQYTLGGRGEPKPDCWWLVVGGYDRDHVLHAISATKRRDGKWSLDIGDGLVVADPSWR